jgi:hypothetical protein
MGSKKENNDIMKVKRADFLKKLIQVILALMLGIIVLVLSRRTVTGNKCIGCPGKGICRGETDCSNFLAFKK